MTFKAKVEHAAAVTKWKADQQIRIVKIQNQISDMEKQIKERIYVLGEATMVAGDQGKITVPELEPHLKDLVEMRRYFFDLQNTLEATKNEAPPPAPEPVPKAPVGAYPGVPALVCPQCGKPLPGRFCPEHGVEGVMPAPPPAYAPPAQEPYQAPPVTEQEMPVVPPMPPMPDMPQVTTPDEGEWQTVGEEMVEKTGEAIEAEIAEAGEEIAEVVEEISEEALPPMPEAPKQLYCPICDAALDGAFCPEHGVPGIEK